MKLRHGSSVRARVAVLGLAMAGVIAAGWLMLRLSDSPDMEALSPPVPESEPGEVEYPGRPPAGSVLWGAAVGGNGDPIPRHERPAEHPLTLRRTFFQWDHRGGYLLDVVRVDLTAGRLPWVSIKTPPWSAMAAGDHDHEIDQLLRGLDAADGPVWLTVHHEPEGGGGVNRPDDPAGAAGHLAMNRRVRQRMDELAVDNVALAPVLMSWTWDPASGRSASAWWEPGLYDFLGVDVYVEQDRPLADATWRRIREWAAERDVDVAVGEWGMRGTDAAAGQRVRDWYDEAADSHQDGRGARVVGLAAFDSGLNAPTGSWELQGGQLNAFHELLRDERTHQWSSS